MCVEQNAYLWFRSEVCARGGGQSDMRIDGHRVHLSAEAFLGSEYHVAAG